MSSFNHVSADAKEKNEKVREGEREKSYSLCPAHGEKEELMILALVIVASLSE